MVERIVRIVEGTPPVRCRSPSTRELLVLCGILQNSVDFGDCSTRLFLFATLQFLPKETLFLIDSVLKLRHVTSDFGQILVDVENLFTVILATECFFILQSVYVVIDRFIS